jgi:chloride channel protein, CIC family
MKIDAYSKRLFVYIQTSETIFLLLFANLIGAGAGFGAILFRWLIAFFQRIFFDDGKHVLSFMGSYSVILIPAIGGLVVGLLIYFFLKSQKVTVYPK